MSAQEWSYFYSLFSKQTTSRHTDNWPLIKHSPEAHSQPFVQLTQAHSTYLSSAPPLACTSVRLSVCLYICLSVRRKCFKRINWANKSVVDSFKWNESILRWTIPIVEQSGKEDVVQDYNTTIAAATNSGWQFRRRYQSLASCLSIMITYIFVDN